MALPPHILKKAWDSLQGDKTIQFTEEELAYVNDIIKDYRKTYPS